MSAPSASARLMLSLVAARAAFGLSYLIGTLRSSPIPWYYPLERRWAIESTPAGFAMGWYGRTGVALLVAAIAFGIAWIAASRGPLARALGRPEIVTSAARAVVLMMLVDFTYFGWVLMHQTPQPLPLPPGYSGF